MTLLHHLPGVSIFLKLFLDNHTSVLSWLPYFVLPAFYQLSIFTSVYT